jgi:hypothetical protein
MQRTLITDNPEISHRLVTKERSTYGIPFKSPYLHSKGVKQWIICNPLSVNVYVTLVKLFLKQPAVEITLNQYYPSKTQRVLLHDDGSKHCTCPLNKFI